MTCRSAVFPRAGLMVEISEERVPKGIAFGSEANSSLGLGVIGCGGRGNYDGGEFLNNSGESDNEGPEEAKLLVKRAAYRRFSRWMDQQLTELVARWGHLATPNARRFSRSAVRRSKT